MSGEERIGSVGGEFDPAEYLRQERRQARRAARAFMVAVRAGDVEQFLMVVDLLHNETVDGWRLAMRGVARLQAVDRVIQQAFLNVWIESKHLALRIGDRPTFARAARKLFPRDYAGPPLRLYRGTHWRERRSRLYGFSWSTQREIAQRFADQHSEAATQLAASPYHTEPPDHLAGIVLTTVAPPEAILLQREEEGYYDEGEVVVDPFRLGAIDIDRGRD